MTSKMTTTTSTTILPLARRVLLGFDDFSLAGGHLVQYVDVHGCRSVPSVPQDEALAGHVAITHFTRQDERGEDIQELTVLAIRSSVTDAATCWKVADALVRLLSTSGAVEELVVLASLHLPQAKAHTAAMDNVYHGLLPGPLSHATAHEGTLKFAAFDPTWEIKDPFLGCLVHLLQVEQAVATTHLVLAKGYRPGRGGLGTLEAMDTLAKALNAFYEGHEITVDLQTAVREHTPPSPSRSSASSATASLLYQ